MGQIDLQHGRISEAVDRNERALAIKGHGSEADGAGE
jgi:hypothetical protein